LPIHHHLKDRQGSLAVPVDVQPSPMRANLTSCGMIPPAWRH
jgi:hypothetical protein